MNGNLLTLPSGKTAPALGVRGACRLSGGVKAVALKAGVTQPALSHWLAGKPAISPANAERVMTILGLPGGEPRKNAVTVWDYAKPWGPQDEKNQGLRLYFAAGAEMVRAPWSRPDNTLADIALQEVISKTGRPPEIYLLSGGGVRAVLKRPSRGLIYAEMMGDGFTFRPGRCEVDITSEASAWLSGEIYTDMFDRAFGSQHRGLDEILELAISKGVGAEDLYRIVEEL